MQLQIAVSHPLITVGWFTLGSLLAGLPGCGPDEAPLKAENEALKKQVAKQESLLASLQDSNRVMQQQIDLLNQELRDAKQATESAKEATARLNEQLEAQLAQVKRMTAEMQRVTQAQATLSVKADDRGAQLETITRPLAAVAKVTEEALAQNGYQIKAGFRSDQQAVYVTNRKISSPASLEVPGFRNQYLVSLQAVSGNATKVAVKAEFEKIAQGGKILTVSAEETAEIERRLISEINKAFTTAGKT